MLDKKTSRYKNDEYRTHHAEWARGWRKKNKQQNYDLQKRWKANNPEKYKAIQENAGLKKNYGITTIQRNEMLAAQGNCCAICKSDHPNRKAHTWAVDHCHTTGKIRGVLCHHCNSMLGYARDRQDLLLKAAEYLANSLELA